MPKIEISKDQNTVTIDNIEYEFKEIELFTCGNECAFLHFGQPQCGRISNYLCLASKRNDNKNGVFILKQKK